MQVRNNQRNILKGFHQGIQELNFKNLEQKINLCDKKRVSAQILARWLEMTEWNAHFHFRKQQRIEQKERQMVYIWIDIENDGKIVVCTTQGQLQFM